MRDERLARAVAGRTVVVTGASSGIGESTARRLGGAGARVVLVARRRAELEALAAELPGAVVAPCDLADAEAVDALLEDLALLDVDVLVSNAGLSIRRALAASPHPARDAERMAQVNYLGPVRLICGLLDGLAARGGQVVVVSSIAAQSGAPGFAGYAASKAALDAFVRSAATERAARGVAFTTINMPLVRTPMVAPSPGLTAGMASLSARAAAELVADAVVHRPRRIATPAGELAQLGWSVDPARSARIDRLVRPLRTGTARGVATGGGRSARGALGRLAGLAVTSTVRR